MTKVTGVQFGPAVLLKEREDSYDFAEKSPDMGMGFARVLVVGYSTDSHLSSLLYPSTLANENQAYSLACVWMNMLF